MTATPAGWLERPLAACVDVLDSRRVPVNAKERNSRRGAVPYYGATGRVGTIDASLFDEDLVLLGEDGVQFFETNKPKAYRISGPAWVNNHAHVLRPNRQIVDDRFLTYFLNFTDYRGFANGTTRLKLTQAAMLQMPVLVPPLPEQRRIVDLLEDHLSRLDAAKASLVAGVQRANALYASHLWGLTHRVEGDRVPLESVAGVRLGRQRSPANHTGDSMWRYLRAANVDWDTLRLDEVKEMNFTANEASRYHLKEGDILLVEV